MFQSSRLGVLCLILVACVSSAVGVDVYDDPTLIIATASGPIQGYHSEYANLTARAWLGIPYASPPNGTLRFKPPTPPESWSQLRDASVAGPGCQQSCSLPPGLCPPVLSEDCLYLNVFAPESMDGTLLPVMIWIHGGNFRQGSGSTGMYDGTVFVNSTQVILVTINYRLGALGFFWNQDSPANNGLLDQQMAMQWVQKNIFNFGGDATRVTIFGQSAGGTSVSCHLQNSVSRSLFSRAIIQSVPLGIPVRFPNEAKALNQIFAQALNCSIDDTKCLQAADIPDILTATGHAAGQLGPNMQHLLEIAQAWQPTLQMNSFNIPLPLTEYFQQYPGDKPLMIGTTSQEAYLFIYELINSSMSSLATAALEAVIFGFNSVGPLGQLYPLSSSSDNRDALSELASDELFLCAAGNATDGMVASAPQTPIFLYQYDHVAVDGAQGWGPHYKVCWTKVCHGADVPMVFGSADAGGSTFSEDEWVLSSYMRAYWGNFATNGNPNVGEPVPLQWPQVTKARETMHFVTGELEIIQNANGNKCQYLDTLGYTL